MKIIARFNVNGKATTLETETGFVSFADRGRIALLKSRIDKQGDVHQVENLNGGRMTKPELLEVSAPTLAALLEAVEADTIRLRGPVRQVSNQRVIHHRNHATGADYYYTA